MEITLPPCQAQSIKVGELCLFDLRTLITSSTRLGSQIKEKSFLNIALKAAEDSECGSQHGSIVTKSGSVMSIGTNRYRNNISSMPGGDISRVGSVFSFHAEEKAISRATGDSIYVARINKQGQPRLSMPCDRCFNLIVEAGFKKIVFTTNGGAAKILI